MRYSNFILLIPIYFIFSFVTAVPINVHAGTFTIPPGGFVLTGKQNPLITSKCGPNQYFDTFADTKNQACIDIPTTVANTVVPIINGDLTAQANAVLNQSANSVNDPYCPRVVNTNVCPASIPNCTGLHTGTSASAYMAPDQSCVLGEAVKNANYTNPWINVANLVGVKPVQKSNIVSYNPKIVPASFYAIPRYGLKKTNSLGGDDSGISPSNLCSYPVSIQKAKKLKEFFTYLGLPSDFTDKKRLLVQPGSASISPNLASIEDSLMTNTGFDGTGTDIRQGQWWDGSIAWTNADNPTLKVPHPYNKNDWSNPEFQKLFNNFQFDPADLAVCLDTGYKSNFPNWERHYLSGIKYMKSKGWWTIE